LLLAEEVDALAKIIAEQLRAACVDSVIYYTKAPESNPKLEPYLEAIEKGCSMAKAILEIRLINGGKKMRNWRDIMNDADAAKKLMISDRKAGEGEFLRLNEEYPSDGMIYFKRGEAFEVIGEYSTALGDFEKAEILLPMQEWKLRARAAIERVKGKADNTAISNVSKELVYDHQQLSGIYNSLQMLLSRIEKERIADEDLSAQITRLKDARLIPSNIANLMHTLRKDRNDAIHKRMTFAGNEAEVIRAAWAAPAGVHERAWHYLLSLAPDIAVMQEACPPKWVNDIGNLHFLPTRRGWGTAIWTPHVILEQSALPACEEAAICAPILKGYTATATVSVSKNLIMTVMSVHAWAGHVPRKDAEGMNLDGVQLKLNPHLWPADLVFACARNLAHKGTRFIIGGDWNTALLFDTTYGPRGNEEFFNRMEQSGLHNAHGKFHSQEEQSYFKKGKGPYQLDHVFCDQDTLDQLTMCDVRSMWPVQELSDHAPLVVEANLIESKQPEK
jgi:tetratricopeptide (TPR) repeat protein